MCQHLTRRRFMASATALGATATAAASRGAEVATPANPQFRYCLNTSTIAGQKLTLAEEVDLVAKAGYDGIEPWIREIRAHVEKGGSLRDMSKRLADHGLHVESAIGFAQWIVDDESKRKAGLEEAKRDMDLVRQIGGTRIAAPPAGATSGGRLDLFEAAKRYRALLVSGADIGVTPQIEVWGGSQNLSRLGEAVFVAIESGHDDACLLPDVYQIYKGGSDFAGLKMVAGTSMHCFHVNDYPADPPRATIGDKDRVYSGDGIAPLNDVFRTLAMVGFSGALSLELFNRDYWAEDAAEVLSTGLRKMKESVTRALG